MSLQFDQSPINSPGASFTTVGPGGMVNNSQQYTTNTSNLRQRPDNRQKNSNFGIVNLTLGNRSMRGDDFERTDPLTKLIDRMSPGASYDAAERGDPPRCHEETRKVIRTHLTSWGESVSQDYLRWLTGSVGTGKSTIAQTIAKDFADKGLLGASFFFFRTSSDRNSIRKFVPSIAYQLAMAHAGLRAIIADTLSYDAMIFEKSFEGQWQKLVVDPLRRVQPLPAPLLIVIDGVDECGSQSEQIKLLNLILESTKQLTTVKFLVSSRPEPHIERSFNKFGLDDSHKITLGASDSDITDIQTFLRLSFDEIYKHRQRQHTMPPTPAPWPHPRVLQQLALRASGQFAYAATIVSFVDDDDKDPDIRLQAVINYQARPFTDLENLYLCVLNRAMDDSPRHHRSLLYHILVQLLITPHLALAASFWYIPDLELFIIIRRLSSVVALTHMGSSILIGIRHTSFRHFLLRPSFNHPFVITSTHVAPLIVLTIRRARWPGGRSESRWCTKIAPTPRLIWLLFKSSTEGAKQENKLSGFLCRTAWFVQWVNEQRFLYWLKPRFPEMSVRERMYPYLESHPTKNIYWKRIVRAYEAGVIEAPELNRLAEGIYKYPGCACNYEPFPPKENIFEVPVRRSFSEWAQHDPENSIGFYMKCLWSFLLFLFIGLPYYWLFAISQTAPCLYKFRTPLDLRIFYRQRPGPRNRPGQLYPWLWGEPADEKALRPVCNVCRTRAEKDLKQRAAFRRRWY